VVIDSDNHYPPWMEIWNGSSFVASGEHPVMSSPWTGAARGRSARASRSSPTRRGRGSRRGRSARWTATGRRSGYRVSIERQGDRFTLQVSGDFRHGGNKTHTASVDAAERCVFHYNRQPLAAGSPCIDSGHYRR